jgi:phage terminase small subunit
MSQQELNWKQKVFCKAYLSNGYNATQAAITAGYSKESATVIGYENLTKPYIQEYINKEMEKLTDKLDLSTEYLFSKLKDCIDLSLLEKNGEKTLVNHNALLGAIQEVNKMKGYYKQGKEADGKLDDMKEKLDQLVEQNKKDY